MLSRYKQETTLDPLYIERKETLYKLFIPLSLYLRVFFTNE
ncbi:hypothetical protein CTO_0980 [Chlamydia trachomatis A2497]|uniref:Uncharacterized protein n=1 Tax=Chlamydia trachomatis serovar A (strain A2497) TaxID=580047 RepID=G4NP99_CHLT4|nr:hypothetical protein G11222_02540 [Chlamydia trachomatis G/11222]ADH20959.1 hypothetical protein E11023_02545 [Chlamydia trachomatis E/11023]AEJ77593.1 hypothetical protein CTL2C_674 [Chlamydia trachomatis L2c]AEP35345.1 hypothetical protein CTO_0980 [Chlamydia trachomatis A2497]AGJ64854.1 hypothetical protein CTLINITIAL_03875 [Chlamydia trachomatis L2/434/Bu(i)]AGJ65796.1 hypothetical protein CTLFINAL_03885 [Chlamydia trachomatis L2/434/Bu(f)]AGR94836.1 hypothetical protein CTRC46_02550 [